MTVAITVPLAVVWCIGTPVAVVAIAVTVFLIAFWAMLKKHDF